jgi:hypothetical protein
MALGVSIVRRPGRHRTEVPDRRRRAGIVLTLDTTAWAEVGRRFGKPVLAIG